MDFYDLVYILVYVEDLVVCNHSAMGFQQVIGPLLWQEVESCCLEFLCVRASFLIEGELIEKKNLGDSDRAEVEKSDNRTSQDIQDGAVI